MLPETVSPGWKRSVELRKLSNGMLDLEPWHAVRVLGGSESTVARALRALDGFSPVYDDDVSGGLRPLLPGYVFARWETHDPFSWYFVRRTRHVIGFIGSPWPVEVSDPVVERWFDQQNRLGAVILEENQLEVMRGFGPGDLLKLINGPFTGTVGVVRWVGTEGVKLKMIFLGREIEVYALFDDIAAPGAEAPRAAASRSQRRRMRRQRRLQARSRSVSLSPGDG